MKMKRLWMITCGRNCWCIMRSNEGNYYERDIRNQVHLRMTSDGDRGCMANTLFPIYQLQDSQGVECGSNDSGPFISIPGMASQEAESRSYVPWSHNAHDDPYQLINCAQNHVKNRKAEVSDDAETELQGLVSEILGEADSQDSLFNNGSLGQHSKNIWSPKILRDELLQYFQSEAKTQYSNFAPNSYTSHDAFGKAQGQEVKKDTGEHGYTNQLFTSPNAVLSGFTQPQKMPPGLPFPPNMANTYLQLQANNYENIKDRANGENVGNFEDLNQFFRAQNNMKNSDLFYEEHYNQVLDKPAATAIEQFTSQDLNQLVSCFQSFVTGEQEGSSFTSAPPREDNIADKWGSPSVFMQVPTSTAQNQRQQGQEFGSKRQVFKRDSLQDLSAYSLQSPEYSSEQTLSMGSHNKMIQKGNVSIPFAMNHYPKPQVQQSPLKFKSQMQKERKRTPAYFGDSFTVQPPTGEVLSEEKQPGLSQNHFYDFPGSARPQKININNMIPPQFVPLMYAGNDTRRRPAQISNHTNITPRGSVVYRGVPSMDMTEVVSANEMSGGFSPGLNSRMSRRAESTYQGMSQTPVAQEGPVLQLYFHLDECYEQWRSLEKERKRTESIISKTFVSKRTMTFPNSSLPKAPPNPSRVDHLIVNQMKEQARVSSLLDKMESLSSVALNANIYNTLSKHHMAICVTSARRKEEILSMSQGQRDHFTEERDTMLLVIALKDLAAATRTLRTGLWCALQITLPKPAPRPEAPVCEQRQDQKHPFEGYSYSI